MLNAEATHIHVCSHVVSSFCHAYLQASYLHYPLNIVRVFNEASGLGLVC